MTLSDATDPESIARDSVIIVLYRGGTWVFLPDLNPLNPIECFAGPSPLRRSEEDQDDALVIHGVVILSSICLSVTFILYSHSLFLFLSFSLSLYLTLTVT